MERERRAKKPDTMIAVVALSGMAGIMILCALINGLLGVCFG